MHRAEQFSEHLSQAPNIIDPVGVHHVFSSGGHGQKIDMDAIPDDTFLFNEWVEVVAEEVETQYPKREFGKIIILSVDGGTNRLVGPISEAFGTRALPALTQKHTENPRSVILTASAEEIIQTYRADLVLALEDVGTTGEILATALVAAHGGGAKQVAGMNTIQRSRILEKLISIGADYSSIIHKLMPVYSPQECQASGFCAHGWELLEKAK